jgi:small-conductance mechanosensitive channel
MVNKVFLTVIAADFLFLISGAIALGFSLVVKSQTNNQSSNGEDAVRKLLAKEFPLTGGIVNGILILVAFVLTLPGMWLPARGWLKLTSAAVTGCGLFSLILGIYVWVMTLRFRRAFEGIYMEQTPETHSLFQTTFSCCGYINSTSPAFVTDSVCPSPAAAALAPGCAGSISNFSNTFMDQIFTALFGFVGIDALFVVAIACLLKDRKERERYRYIDEKTGYYQI